MATTKPVFPVLNEAAPLLPLPLKLPDPDEDGAEELEEPVVELPVVVEPLGEVTLPLAPLMLEAVVNVVLKEADALVGAWAMAN